MVELVNVVVSIDPASPLDENWNEMATSLLEQGATVDQLDAMHMAFYVGAASVYGRVNNAAQGDIKTFTNVMAELFKEIDCVMTNGLLSTTPQGHA
jgi:hypothetical protein